MKPLHRPAQPPAGAAGSSTGADAPPAPTPRLRLKPLFVRLLLTLLLPVSAALLLDGLLGTRPWLMLAAALLCIPLATVVVGKATLRDFERVLTLVAPPAPAADDSALHSAEVGAEAGAGHRVEDSV